MRGVRSRMCTRTTGCSRPRWPPTCTRRSRAVTSSQQRPTPPFRARDRDRIGSTWAQFHTHLYSNFYVYQYATGIAAADHLVERVAAGDQKAVESYRAFLRSAGSRYPLEGLRMAGVDMTSPEPVEAAFATLASMGGRLGKMSASLSPPP